MQVYCFGLLLLLVVTISILNTVQGVCLHSQLFCYILKLIFVNFCQNRAMFFNCMLGITGITAPLKLLRRGTPEQFVGGTSTRSFRHRPRTVRSEGSIVSVYEPRTTNCLTEVSDTAAMQYGDTSKQSDYTPAAIRINQHLPPSVAASDQ